MIEIIPFRVDSFFQFALLFLENSNVICAKLKCPMSLTNNITIGATDKIDFPEFDLENLDCRIDTGAASSAIHCQNITIRERNGEEVLSFQLLDRKHPMYNKKTYHTKEFQRKTVRSSFGQEEIRYAITTKVVLFGKTFETQFTLADRVKMRFPVLIGRKLLRQGFVVNIRKKNLSYNKKIKNTL
ncbi:MAG: ATP-dependent zinc protease [Cryomorphaceae bacterium]|nr:ATP-dependent zinc protease [Cryomorphaceae bacterium]